MTTGTDCTLGFKRNLESLNLALDLCFLARLCQPGEDGAIAMQERTKRVGIPHWGTSCSSQRRRYLSPPQTV